jgi:hypothetical protein
LGYVILMRSTTSALWEREIYVGNVSSYRLPDFSVDDVVVGVKALDRDLNQSLVSAYDLPVVKRTGEARPEKPQDSN